MKRLVAFAALAISCSSSADVVFSGPPKPDYDAVSRLNASRRLRCRFTAVTTTMWVDKGDRTVTAKRLDNKSGVIEVAYRDIDRRKGTAARDLGYSKVAYLTVKVDNDGALWMVETTPMGGLFVSGGFSVTTVFPTYAGDSHDFIVLQSQHTWRLPGSVDGTQYSGTCAVMD